jgi:outer membrane protein assembly factor BamB
MTRFILILNMVVLLAACSSEQVITEDSALRPAELVAFDPTLSVKLSWSVQLNRDDRRRGFDLAPVARDGAIFVTETGGRVAAYDALTGALRWERLLNITLSSGPGVGDGAVMLGSEDGELIVLETADGATRWRATTSSEILAAPQISAGKVVISVNDGKIVAYDAQNGQRLWVSANTVPALSLRGGGRPVIVGERVIVGFANGSIAAFNLNNGKRLWETAVAVPKGRTEIERLVDVDTTPRIAGGVVYAVAYQGQVAALSIENGQTLWSREGSSFTDFVIDESRLYFTDATSQLWALDRKTGATLWRQEQLRARLVTGPALLDEYLVVGDFQGYVHWMRREDGHFVARTHMKEADRRAVVAGKVFLPEDDESSFRQRAGIRVSPWVVGDQIYVRDENGVLAAYRVGS